ncbi:uncharacterized protein BJ171DRAFT_424340 [Polychytrium aggregatum]|uniref:uncharacterized protein n=1 Tax=Polychytrium aggregatum TaxID=110093 RepID=UPI0022FED79C|nr:uncharacterized protein BJ171DRAFT_424340 [Polychytrium aggregatum]KAI9204376.1 hypothetical protein BJ171DRAFT_424340 [Polychytrium aggregatum]
MRIGERARFLCMPDQIEGFAQLETVLRQEKKAKETGVPRVAHGCCAHSSPDHLEENQDLAHIYESPLELDITLVAVHPPGSFLKEPWEMNAAEKWAEVPVRKSEGNAEYGRGNYEEACAKYTRALVLLESLDQSSPIQDQRRDRDQKKAEQERRQHIAKEEDRRRARLGLPSAAETTSDATASSADTTLAGGEGVVDLDELTSLMQTCRLNYAACKLKLRDWNTVIIQCSEVLKHDPKCVKALFRRSQAYAEIGRDLDLAEKDIGRLREIIQAHVADGTAARDGPEEQELRRMARFVQAKVDRYAEREKKMFSNMFS